MKKSFLFFILTIAIMLSSCVAVIENESSIPQKIESESNYDISNEVSSESESDVSSLFVDSDSSFDESASFDLGVTAETIDFGSFTVETEHAVYDFLAETGTGDYRTEFTTAETSSTSITITLSDGRTMQLNHTGIVYDEENDIYRTEINDLDFWVYEYHDSNNNLCQVYNCIEPLDNLGDFKGRVISTITVNYNPELESGDIKMIFLYEIQGDKVIISYPDGMVLTKTVKYDKDNNKYYFE